MTGTQADTNYDPTALPVYRPDGRALGVCFENVTVTGVAGGESQVTDFGVILKNLISLPITVVRQVANNRQRKVRNIIEDVSGIVPPGEIMMVLGTPGAGCSTALRAISSDIESFVDVQGQISYSTMPSNEIMKNYKSEVVYNGEEDLHFPSLTVGNTLAYALKLRKPAKDTTKTAQFVDSIRSKLLEALDIPHTIKTIVGNSFVRGVSGGERKRVSLAEVLATNPAVACWDQPNRGLDSSSALTFFRLLKNMARSTGMAHIVTLYQASESMFQECTDRVLLLYEGRMIFCGKVEHAKKYFVDMGYLCEARQTTPDFLTSVTSPTERSVREDHVGPIPRTPDEFAQEFRTSTLYRELENEIKHYKSQAAAQPERVQQFKEEATRIRSKMTWKTAAEPASLWKQVMVTIQRHYQLTWGERSTLFMVLFLNAVNAVITGSCFYKAPANSTGAYEIAGAIYFSLIYFCFNAFAETPSLVMSRSIITKQKKLGISHPAAFAIAQAIADLPISLFQTLVFSCCYYFMIGLAQTASQFWIFQLILFLHYVALSNIFRMLAAAAPDLNLALLMAGASIPVLLEYGGFAPPTPTFHRWGSWIRRIPPTPYALEALLGNDFNTLDLTCSASQMVPSGPSYTDVRYQVCSIAGSTKGSTKVPGSTYLELIYAFSRSHLWRNFGILVSMSVIYMIFTAVALTFTAKERGGSGGHVFKRGAKISIDNSAPAVDDDLEKQVSRDIHSLSHHPVESTSSDSIKSVASGKDIDDDAHKTPDGASFTFQGVNYFVNVAGEERQLLTNVAGYAKPGQLTALMGTSGAGKTTLLDTISQRKSEGRVEGRMLLNGSPLDMTFGRSCGFCMQQDVHEPMLTIRESFQFSACMRQPAEVPKSEKHAYVEHIIDLLELGPIADAIIGVPGEGGLGVEERKRVTIGVELAAKPSALLFLDEPTSGLDSQAAYSIMFFLRKIAAQGIPIICTIHQPSGVLFEMFDHVLLLARGGRTIYFGESGMDSQKVVEYFGRHGAHMGDDENPAEFIVETVSGEMGDVWSKYWDESPERIHLEEKINHLNEHEKSKSAAHASSPAGAPQLGSTQYALPFWSQTIEVTKRHWVSVWREGNYDFSKTFKSIWLPMFTAFTFFKLSSDLQGLQNYVLSLLILVQIIQAIAPDIQNVWFSKWAIFEARERNGIYDAKALATALIVVEIPWQIVNYTLAFLVMYWTVGFPNTTTIAGFTYFMWLLFSYFGTSMAHLIAAMFQTQKTSAFANSLFWTIIIIFSGTLVPHKSLNVFYRYWMYWLDPFRWLLGAHVENTLHNVKVHCSESDLSIFDPVPGQTCGEYVAEFLSTAVGYLTNPEATTNCGYCKYSTGDDFLATMDYSYDKRWRDLGLSIVFLRHEYGSHLLRSLVHQNQRKTNP